MKKLLKWICPVLIVVCLAVFFVYRALDRAITDTVAPVITLEEGILELSVTEEETALLRGITATDDRSGDVTDSLVVERVRLQDSKGNALVSYAAFDAAGNVTKAERQVRYTDYVSPRFSLSRPLIFPQNSGVNVLDAVSVTDMLEGDISHRLRATNLSGTALTAVGSYELQFQVTNSFGDTVRLQLPVEVYAAGTYEAGLTLTDYLIYLEAGADFAPESYLKEFTRTGETTDLSAGLPEGFTLHIGGEVDTETPGVYVVSYELTYTQPSDLGSRAYTGYTRLIVVVEG